MNINEIQGTLEQLNNANNRKRFEDGQSNLGSSAIGKDGFLQLMMAQLRYQDPMEPLDNKEFISQQAQFTQIEKLDNLNATMAQSNIISQAGNWVGKTVKYVDDKGDNKSGYVSSVQFGDNGSLGLTVDGKTVSPSQVKAIVAQDTTN